MSNQLTRDLKLSIESYFQGEPYGKHRCQSLSNKAGVSHNTISRILAEDLIPTFETAFSLLRVIRPNDYQQILQRYFSDTCKWKEEREAANRNDNIDNQIVDDQTEDYIGYRIFSLACSRQGTTREDINRLHGEEGNLRLEEMLQSEILMQDKNGNIKTCFHEYSTVSIRANIRKIEHCLKSFRPDFIDKKVGFLGTHTEKVNQDGIEELKKECKRFFTNIGKIKSDQRYYGKIPVYLNMMMGVFDTKEVKRANEVKGD